MSYTQRISASAWIKLYHYLAEFPKIHTSNEAKARQFVEGVFWILRGGSQWRLLPKEYGDWNAIYHRFADWADKGVWYKMLYYFARDPDMEYIMVDSTILRAHACAAGAIKKKHGAQDDQALGRSRGGFSTKIHGVCDALGNPLGFILTGGQKADCIQAIPLLQGLHFQALLADKGYDADAIIAYVEAQGGVAVIPPKSNRIVQREYDKQLYKERHKIECAFGFLKHYRRIFSRFDKIAARFSAFLHFAAALQWLK